jgi:hypothetical protein
MTQEEMQLAMRRFSRMHSYFLRLISSDPTNAKFYKILVEHYQAQYSAMGNHMREMAQQCSEPILVLAA